MAVPVGGARGRRGARAVQHGQLHHGVEQAQRLIMGDMLLRLRGQNIGQQQVAGGIGHGDFQALNFEGFGGQPPLEDVRRTA